MQKDQVVAHVLMERTSEPMPITNIRDYQVNGLLYVKFDTCLQSFDVQNRNKRMYDANAIMESLAAPHVQELIRKGSFVSEYGHPFEKDLARVTQIDPARICGRVNSYYRQGNLLKGEFETFDDGGLGTMLTRRILQKMEPAHSLRAVGPLSKTRDGKLIMKSKAHIVAYDTVILPSHVEAYRDESKETQIIKQPILAESFDVTDITEEQYMDQVFALNESMLTDFVKEESKNVKLVKSVCEVVPEKIMLTSDLKNMILKEGVDTYYVKVEDKIKHDITNFMRRF